MAIYDLGTASLAANGEVTGVGTTWKAPLTLIRVGATIVFKTEPVQIYTISEIISDTRVNVYNPNSETVPVGTGYAILAHDGITVQGLAQDVSETLRYYQSRETEVADAVDAFNNFDSADFESKVTQVNTQHGDVVSIGAQVANDAAQASSDKDSAAASAISASADKDAAAASAQEAADYAASLDTQNLLRKDLALSDLTDKPLARSNLDVYSKSEVNNKYLNALDFGVVDDGVTDNSAAFQACFNAVSAEFPNGAEVYIPASKHAVGYYVGSTVTVPSGVNIRGGGRGSQIRAKSTLTGAVLRLSYDSHTTGRYLKDISITGNNSCNGIETNLSPEDPVIRQVYGWKFDHVSVNEVDTAYHMQGLWHSQFIACQAGTCRIGLHLLGQCVSVLVSGCHFSRDGGPTSNSFGIRVQPTTYAWNGSSPVRSEAIVVNGETMCIGFQFGVYIDDGLDVHLSNLDLDYCREYGVVVQNINGGFSLVNSWIAADMSGTSQFFGVTFPGMTSPQQNKLLQGLHINAGNSNSTNNNVGINVGQGAGKMAIKDCTIATGGGTNTSAIAFYSNTEGSVVSGCILGAPLYLQSSGNLTIRDNELASITDVFKSAVNAYSSNSGVNTDGIIEVPILAGQSSGSATITNKGSGTYICTSYANDSASIGDGAYISGSNINVTRQTPVGFNISSWVHYRMI